MNTVKSHKNMQKHIRYYKIFPILILFSFFFISIGYAAINSITMEVSGVAVANAQTGVFITSATTLDSLSTVDNYYKTMLESTTTLSTTLSTSSVVYTITIFNNTLEKQTFTGVKYEGEFYDNENIVFELDGLAVGDSLEPNESKTFNISFHYLDYNIVSNNVLKSYLNFEFKRIYSVQYINFSDDEVTTNNYPTMAIGGESLVVNFVDIVPDLVVSMDDNELLKDSDYTYVDNVLTIPNVNGDIIIRINTIVGPVQGADGNYFEGSAIPGNGTILEDKWTGDVYNLTLGIPSNIGSVTTYTYTVKLTNNTEYVWTNLQNTDIIINSGGGIFGKALQRFSSTLSHNTLNPGETLTITFTIRYRVNLDCSAKGQTIIKLNNNGEEKQIELNINFSMT